LTIQLVVAVLAIHAARYHTVIMIEDAHWIDSTSWTVLRAARMSVKPAMFVVATRPVALPVEFDPVHPSSHTHVLRIHPLTRDDIATLSRQRLGVRSLPEEVIDLIHQRAGGNALFVEELALVLRDRQYIELRGEDAVLAVPVQQLAKSELPATVGGVIVSRLDKLPVNQQVVLKVAAVLGQQFPVTAVQDLYPQHESVVDVLSLLPPLMEQDLIRRGDSAGQFEFKHALAQEAIYGLMLFAQRRGLHKRAAEWFERKGDSDGGIILPILAFHWEQAGEYVKAIACLEQAGEQSLDRYANREATDLLERALTLHTEHSADVPATDDRLANWHRHLAEAWIRLGSLDASRKHGAEALRRLGWPLPQSALGTGLDLVYQLSRRVWAGLVGTKVATDARERERRIHASRVLNRLTELQIYAENAVGAVTGGLRELNTVEPAGPSPELGKALAVMAVLFGPAPPLRRISHRWADRAVSITESSAGVAAPLSYVLCRVAIVDLYVCRWERAVERLDRAIEVARSCGDRRLLEEAIGVGLLVKFFAGRLQETLPMLEQLRNSSRFSANKQIIAWSHLGLAGSKIRLGDAHTAMLELESCDAWVEREGSNSEVLWKRGLTALAQWKLGHHDRALATADAALPLIGWPVAYWMQHALAAIAEVYISALAQSKPGKPDYRPLLDKANLALRGVRRFGLLFGFGRGHALLWQGALEATTGNRQRALATWRHCVAECTRLQLQWELALAHRALALHLPPDAAELGLHTREAASALETMGALAEREPLLQRAHLRPHLGLAALP
jgi:adenylate cyclase